jgi:hypothetical protein
MDKLDGVYLGYGSIEEGVIAAANVINRYARYTPTGTFITYKDEKGENVTLNVPSVQQISELADDVVGENSPYQAACFFSFVTHLAFFFTDADLYELLLLGLANLLGGIQQEYDITESTSVSIINNGNQTKGE